MLINSYLKTKFKRKLKEVQIHRNTDTKFYNGDINNKDNWLYGSSLRIFFNSIFYGFALKKRKRKE